MVPKEIFIDLLEKICEKKEAIYILNINSYKRLKFHDYQIAFLQALLPYYHWSKRFYIERECTYASFMTIVRQLSKLYNMTVSSQLQYSDSSYTIQYSIQ
jgi:hypothetical protein